MCKHSRKPIRHSLHFIGNILSFSKSKFYHIVCLFVWKWKYFIPNILESYVFFFYFVFDMRDRQLNSVGEGTRWQFDECDCWTLFLDLKFSGVKLAVTWIQSFKRWWDIVSHQNLDKPIFHQFQWEYITVWKHALDSSKTLGNKSIFNPSLTLCNTYLWNESKKFD